MKPKWLIEHDVFPEDTQPLLDALNRQNIDYKIVPYSNSDVQPHLDAFPGEDCVIFYGSLGTAKRLRRHAQWIPGIYYDVPKYECVSYYAILGKYLLNGNYVMLPFGDLVRQKEFLYCTVGAERTIFLRPNRGDKTFTGQLVHKENFHQDVERFGFTVTNPDDLVVASEPRNLAFEWRFVVVDDKVVAGSQYRENQRVAPSPEFPQEAWDFAQEIAEAYSPEPVFVVDVCKTIYGEYRLMEIGCFSCAGLYCCDRDTVVRSVSDAALQDWQSYQLD